MARAAVFETLLNDSRLASLGIDEDSLLVNYDGEERPNDATFIVLGWSNEETGLRGDDTFLRPFRNLTVWVHIYRQVTTDFVRIDNILKILDDILLNMIHVAGSDGETVTLVESAGRSRDMRDDSYQTICRSVSYRILSRETATV